MNCLWIGRSVFFPPGSAVAGRFWTGDYFDCLSLHEMNVEQASTQTDLIENWPLQNANCGLTILGRHSFFNLQSGGRQLQLQAKQSNY